MNGARILIADDEASIRRLLGRLCQQEGYDVVLAESGALALAALEAGPFDVSIVDLHFPDINGLDILRRAKDLYPDGEVIILTGHGDLPTALEAMRLGAYDYLQKPIRDLQLILIAIARAMERQRLSRHNEMLVRELQTANRELNQHRRQQIQYIHHIGQALAGALRSEDVARVLVQAILGSIMCDAAGALVLPRVEGEMPLAVLGASRPLSPRAQQELVRALTAELPESLRPATGQVQVATIVTESEGVDDDDWAQRETGMLAVREHVSGAVILADHDAAAFSEETRAVFGILASQGSVALENAYLFARMRELATRDSLTGLYNHGHFFEMLEAEISRAERYRQEFALIMFDHDNRGLKRINDTYGHQAGDQLLREVAWLVEENVRRADVVARYGGDEFVVLAPQTGREQALILAERICSRLHDKEFMVSGHSEHVTVSVGLTVFHPECGETASTVVARADQGLYQAKELGGDRVCLAE